MAPYLRAVVGVVLVVIGIVGIVLPIMPGLPFLVAGVALVAPNHWLTRTLADRLRALFRGKDSP
jgi:uncharacterized membrane protein YbaN (DUF454 family)